MERNTYPTNPFADILVGYFSSFSKATLQNYYKYSTNNNYKYENCTMHGYSLVYFENVKDYYIISDAICNGKQMPINRLIGELSEDEKLPPETEAPVSDDLLYDSCDKCPDNLCELDLTCSKSGDCKEQSYFGDKCNKLCEEISPYCKICSREGICLECTDQNHFGPSCDELCNKCPGGTCDIYGKCIEQTSDCEGKQYYGPKCNIKCKNDFCVTCDRNGKCFECEDNKYSGDNCEHECKNCPEGKCNINNGKCTNQENDCADQSYYGDDCQTSCSNLISLCQKCKRNGACIECKDELYFGNDCSNTCDKCPNEKCNISGECNDKESNCKNDEYYGEKCDIQCDSVIEKQYCIKCDRDGTCNKCLEDRYWGINCEKECSNCPGKTCDINGVCINQDLKCEDKIHYGEKCDLECDSNCKECNRQGECTSCIDNHNWSPKCENQCLNCPGIFVKLMEIVKIKVLNFVEIKLILDQNATKNVILSI